MTNKVIYSNLHKALPAKCVCTNKVKHKCLQHAKIAAYKQSKSKNKSFTAYHCGYCKCYHIGSSIPKSDKIRIVTNFLKHAKFNPKDSRLVQI